MHLGAKPDRSVHPPAADLIAGLPLWDSEALALRRGCLVGAVLLGEGRLVKDRAS